MRPLLTPALAVLLACAAFAQETYDVVVYGGTSAAVIAAVQAKKMGKTVIVVSPDKHLGGLSSGGLGYTDSGDKSVIGGLSRNFYHRVWEYYQKPATWVHQKPEAFGNKGQGTVAMDQAERTMWIFEPNIAEKVFEDLVRENALTVVRDEWLDREKGVAKDGARITRITTLSGKSYAGRMFIDATYEGDLMAAAKVDYHVGREANAEYGERHNGLQVGILHHRHHFGVLKGKVSPYVVPGDPSSGLVANVTPTPVGEVGSADKRLQAYCFRMCLTDVPENRIPFAAPAGYDPKQYEILARAYALGWNETFKKFDLLPNGKTDTNNHGPFSFDYIGGNYDYPEASYERRREIIRAHETYQKGLLYFIATDPRVPEATRLEMQRWGLPKDEFKDNGGWPHQIYVREARRMIGAFVMTENELTKVKPTPDSVGMGSYTIDSHNTQRYVTPEGYVQNEGDIGVSTRGPYEIAYGALVPKKGQADNLLVPVACSATHIAYGSIRMEPVFMILGQSAATAAALALDAKVAVQDVPYADLKARLLADGQVLHSSKASLGIKTTRKDGKALPGITVDDDSAKLSGEWAESSSAKAYVGNGYRHDGNGEHGVVNARFETALPKAGRYEVFLAIVPSANRAKNAKVTVEHAGGVAELRVNLSHGPADNLVSLGTYEFSDTKPAAVTCSNEGAQGYVVIDAANWQAR